MPWQNLNGWILTERGTGEEESRKNRGKQNEIWKHLPTIIAKCLWKLREEWFSYLTTTVRFCSHYCLPHRRTQFHSFQLHAPLPQAIINHPMVTLARPLWLSSPFLQSLTCGSVFPLTVMPPDAFFKISYTKNFIHQLSFTVLMTFQVKVWWDSV